MTRIKFTDLVTACGNPDRGTAIAAQDALIDWWRDEGEQNAEDARELEDARDAQASAEERAAELENARDTAEEYLEALEEARPEMICSVCLHDIRHEPICRTCVEASVDRHVATYPRLAARA
jgi:hypothetical protein